MNGSSRSPKKRAFLVDHMLLHVCSTQKCRVVISIKCPILLSVVPSSLYDRKRGVGEIKAMSVAEHSEYIDVNANTDRCIAMRPTRASEINVEKKRTR